MTKLTLEAPTYQLGDILFSPTSSVIKKNNTLYKLRAKECSLLQTLIEQFPETLSRNDIVDRLYSNTYATDATINQLVKRLRQSLDDDKRSLIRTIPKQGYQLAIAPINITTEVTDSPLNTPTKQPPIEADTTNNANLNTINLSIDKPKRLDDKSERNLERFCGAIAVIGVFLSLVSGYYYAEYNQQHSTKYLDLIDISQYKTNDVNINSPVALSENNQLKSVIINDSGESLECHYDNNTKLTLCQLN